MLYLWIWISYIYKLHCQACDPHHGPLMNDMDDVLQEPDADDAGWVLVEEGRVNSSTDPEDRKKVPSVFGCRLQRHGDRQHWQVWYPRSCPPFSHCVAWGAATTEEDAREQAVAWAWECHAEAAGAGVSGAACESGAS